MHPRSRFVRALLLALVIIPTSGSRCGGATQYVRSRVRRVATIEVELAASSLNPGLTTRATAKLREADRDEITDRAVVWSSSNPAVARVTSTGVVSAIKAGTARIVASSGGKSGSAMLLVEDHLAPGASHEPAGMTLISHRAFDAVDELGWDDEFGTSSRGGMRIVRDPTAPKSPPNVVRITYPTGFSSEGIGPGSAELTLSTRPRTLYVSFWSRFSTNWYGHDSQVNKEFYAFANGKPNVVFIARCEYEGPITPDIGFQDMPGKGEYDISPNLVPTARIIRGKWYHIEVVLVGNTAGAADGSVDWWLDGVHIGSYRNLRFSNSAARWDLFHYSTIWGGVGGPNVPATQTKDWDDLYLSGKP